MDIAKVIGTFVATQKDPSMEGVQISLIQPLDEELQPAGEPIVATDSLAKRGPGEIVYFVTGGDAVYTGPGGRTMPVDAAIMGIVNKLDLKKDILKKYK